jgi:hypothetical protein
MRSLVYVFVFICLVPPSLMAQKNCYSQQYLQQQLSKDPGLASRKASIEKQLQPVTATIRTLGTGGTNDDPVINIPVVVHVVYNSPEQNISDQQIISQLNVLNNDFRKLNADTSKIPAYFRPFAADCGIKFSLANTDPRGFTTTGIIRKQTSTKGFVMDDAVKASATGGDDPWDADSYLNIWICNLGQGIIGYSSPLGAAKTADGVVIKYNAFGSSGNVLAPYNKGRTAVHEIGHWLGLVHIWGDQDCGDDYIDDTPPQKTSSKGCPSGTIVTCNNAPTGNMYMNYMDLTDDPCMNMFTLGQKARMRHLFDAAGPRFKLLSSKGSSGTALQPPVDIPAVDYPAAFISPNPARNELVIDFGSNQAAIGEKINIYSQYGQLMMSTIVNSNKMYLNIGRLAAGIYYVRVGTKTNSYKIVKAAN